ncbi:thioesterase II family protein [Streptomyces rubellomurinus]|uniref:Thioesterase n=1 Tax=Streptomyces rubellomurinus (strain ATCC 31215) TaxID=359131 RepID=A0A0F2T4F6_STRR3|nr:alpha/beta fold hydrolase [Streptomyces rubellomurinus]KJS58099.1 thioesterase [Streptomyces rubellomurinus]
MSGRSAPGGAPDTALVALHRAEGARRALVCLGFCGGGTAAYHAWAAGLPPATDLLAVCYPGREGRFAEDFADSWDALAEDSARAVRAVAATDAPYVLFGHSMGGWMAFDVATRLAAAGDRLPEALVVSSCNAPDRGLTERDRFPAQADPDDGLLGWMSTHGLLPAHVLGDEDLTEMAVELMRADLKVRDTFGYSGARTTVPLQVLSGADDPVVGDDAGARWGTLTTAAHRHDVLPGGHFYTPEVWRALPERIAALGAPAPAPSTAGLSG